MPDYVKSIFRMFTFFTLVFAAMVLAKPKPVLAFVDCCQTCQNRLQACLSSCTGTGLQLQACQRGCEFAESKCIEVCPACIEE